MVTRIYSNRIYVEEAEPELQLKDTKTNVTMKLRNANNFLWLVDQDENSRRLAHLSANTFATDWVECGIGTEGSEELTDIYSLPSGWTCILPLAAVFRFEGTFASGEEVTAELYIRDETGYMHGPIAKHTATTTGDYAYDITWKEAITITSDHRLTTLTVKAWSTVSGTSVTLKTLVIGLLL